MSAEADNTMISVIVPIYNVEKYLRECVESILAQTYKNLEIILVDDGSPDGCWKIMQEYAQKDGRIKIFQKENGGLSDARNFGMQYVTGGWVGFVDSDDIIEPMMYEKMHAKAVAEDCDIVLCSYSCFIQPGKYFMPRPDIAEAMQHLSGKTHTPEQLYFMFFNLGTTVWRGLFSRSFLDKYKEPFPKGLYYEDDYWHTFHRLRARRVAGVNEPLYRYRSRGDSISGGRQYSVHIIEIMRRFEAANIEYLKNQELKANYDLYKMGALKWHLPNILKKYSHSEAAQALGGIKHLMQSIAYCDEPHKALLKTFKETPAEKLYGRMRYRWIREFFSKIGKFAFRARFSRKQKVAYITLFGASINLAPVVHEKKLFKFIGKVMRNFFSAIFTALLRVRVNRASKVAYVRLLGIKIDFSRLMVAPANTGGSKKIEKQEAQVKS